MSQDELSHRPGSDRLSQNDQKAFAWLGTLHQEAIVRPATVVVLWSLPEAEAHERLQRLQEAGLVQTAGEGGYRLDSTMHEKARQLLSQRMALPKAHAHLLEAYRAQTRDGLWHTLPDDGYIHQHLAWHMEQAGWEGEIHALLREETPEGQNGWFEAREALHQTAGYIADVARAWKLAERDRDIGLQCRYALIVASIRSLAERHPPILLAALVREQIWPLPQAMAYAHQIADPGKRAKALAGLFLEVASVQGKAIGSLAEVLAGINQIPDPDEQSKTLAGLLQDAGPALDAALQRMALTLVQEMKRGWYQAEALAGLAPHLSPALLEEAMEIANGLDYVWYRVRSLTALAPHLMEPHKTRVLEQTLALIRQIQTLLNRVRGFSALAPHLSPARKTMVLDEALATAKMVEVAESRYRALASLIPHLREELKVQALREATAAAGALPTCDERARALVELALLAPEPPLLAEALATVRSARYASDRAQLLADLVPYLEGTRGEDILAEALREARQTEAERAHYMKAPALTKVALVLPEAQRGCVLEEALAAAGETEACSLADVLGYLAPHLPKSLLPEALAIARQPPYPRRRVEALVTLVPHLAESGRAKVLAEALAVARMIGDEKYQATLREALLPHQRPKPDSHVGEADIAKTAVDCVQTLTEARAIDPIDKRAAQLAEMAPQMVTFPSPKLGSLWEETLPVLAARSRRNLLSDLHALRPVIVSLGRAEAVAKVLDAVQDVGRWWP